MELPAKQNYEPIWDKANSTYMRNIYLANGMVFTGYSKKYHHNERRDKIELLTNWILRDLKNGYLDKHTSNPKVTTVDRIEYFIKQGADYAHIITLYYSYAEWIDPAWMANRKLVAFITRFYDMVRNKANVMAICNALEVRTRAPKYDPLSLEAPRFTSVNDLNAFVFNMREEGKFELEELQNFYRKYMSKFFNK